MRILLVAILFPVFSFCQKTYKGTILSNNGFSTVPYATIGLIKENIGINADEAGFFILSSLNPKPNDSLIISSVGFTTRIIPLSQILDSVLHINLTENIQSIRPIIISTNKTWKKETLNDYGNCGNEFYTSSGDLRQIAQPFNNSHPNALLSKIKICRSTGPMFNPARTIFRIRVYDVDTLTGGPGVDLCDTIIEEISKNSSTNLNVEKYKIRIPNQRFFIAVEWLKIPYNKKGPYTLPGSNIKEIITYEPRIGWGTTNDANLVLWQLTYRNKWHKISNYYGFKMALISAIIKY